MIELDLDLSYDTYDLTVSGAESVEAELDMDVSVNVAADPYTGSTTVTPTVSAQVLPTTNKLLADDVTINPIPYSYLGVCAELVDGNLYSSTFDLYNSAYHGWTPSGTAQICVASETLSKKFTATGMSEWDYYIVWECGFDPVYDGTETHKALPLFSRAILVQALTRRPSSWTNIENDNFNATACASAYTSTFMRYYGSTTGTMTYTWGTSYGFYWSLVAATFVDASVENVQVNLKTPSFSARTSTTYFSTSNAGKIDESKSKGYIKARLYRAKSDGFLHGVYQEVVNLINEE